MFWNSWIVAMNLFRHYSIQFMIKKLIKEKFQEGWLVFIYPFPWLGQIANIQGIAFLLLAFRLLNRKVFCALGPVIFCKSNNLPLQYSGSFFNFAIWMSHPQKKSILAWLLPTVSIHYFMALSGFWRMAH